MRNYDENKSGIMMKISQGICLDCWHKKERVLLTVK